MKSKSSLFNFDSNKFSFNKIKVNTENKVVNLYSDRKQAGYFVLYRDSLGF